MVENINKKIIKKFDEIETDREIKEFLKEVLLFEIDHMDESKPKYREDYLRIMKKYTEKYEGSGNNED